ncbi:hypothetical protein H5410_023114 [Solanum commersonii]|uniref:Uncharacterized protein n=1 Tax=Solanum commersonii TaxID=4109 RepID=A0A9J5ZFY0_SOLCO|nr:hypothetical protein H5410_023114 [Solanum commersonii]
MMFQNFDIIFAKILHGRLLRLRYESSWPSRPKYPIVKVKRSQFTIFFGDPEFRPHFFKTFTWTFVKTLTMKPVSPQGQNGPFSRSNEPRCSYGSNWPSWSKRPIFKVKRALEKTFVKTLAMEPVGPHGQNDPFLRSNELWSRWPPRPKRPIFKVKQAPEQMDIR